MTTPITRAGDRSTGTPDVEGTGRQSATSPEHGYRDVDYGALANPRRTILQPCGGPPERPIRSDQP
jgi:hypothetical protein